MATGERSEEVEQKVIVTYTYPPANGLAGCTVVLKDGIMTMDATVEIDNQLQEWHTVLPLESAPLMVAIAADMLAELALQNPNTPTLEQISAGLRQ